MTPILRPNASRLQLPRIDEEPIQDEEQTPTSIINENIPLEMFQTRNRTSLTAQGRQEIRLPSNAESNTENSFYDDY